MKPQKKIAEEVSPLENVQVQLKGEDAVRFRQYKLDQVIRVNAIAGEKLIMEGIRRHEETKQKAK